MKKGKSGMMAPYGGQSAKCADKKCAHGPKAKLVKGKGGSGMKGK